MRLQRSLGLFFFTQVLLAVAIAELGFAKQVANVDPPTTDVGSISAAAAASAGDARSGAGKWEQFVSLVTHDENGVYTGLKTPRPGKGWLVTPIHVVLLPPRGKVLVSGWARKKEFDCKVRIKHIWGVTFVLDVADLNVEKLEITPLDTGSRMRSQMWGDTVTFGGATLLPSGQVFFFGGVRLWLRTGDWSKGLDYSHVYDFQTNSFRSSRFSAPFGTAWYPTTTLLPDQRVLVAQGYVKCCADRYRSAALATFKVPVNKKCARPSTPWTPMLSQMDAPVNAEVGPKDYIRMHLLASPVFAHGHWRDVAVIGAAGRVLLLTTEENNKWKESDSKRFTARPNAKRPGDREGSRTTSAIVATGEVLIYGSGVVDLYDPAVDTWRSISSPGHARSFSTGVLLPNGCIAFLGGENNINQNTGKASRGGDPRRPLIFDPFTERWQECKSEPDDGTDPNGTFRGYHNVALLLHDGRILVGGGRHDEGTLGCEHANVRVFTPPWFQDPKGPAIEESAQRNVLKMSINSDQTLIINGCSSPRGLLKSSGYAGSRSGVALMALGAQTHAVDQGQRYVPIKYEWRRNKLVIYAPRSPQATPGYYNLFLVDVALVPSKSSISILLE